MRAKHLLVLLVLLTVSTVKGQNLHTQANAASISNETNATTGWNGNAAITSSTDNPFMGAFAISAASTSATGGGKEMNYTFNAVIGEVYDISIWARLGAQSSQAAFANWFGFNGFTTTPIAGGTWSEYTWSLTATSTNPIIRLYAAQWSGGQVGDEILIDNVSILPVGGGGDTQPPSAVNTLVASGTTTTTTNLSWNASVDNNGVTGYDIFRDGTLFGSTANTAFTVTGLTPNTSYNFRAFARDAAGNTSASGNSVNVATLAGGGDTMAPSAVTTLAASGTTATTTNLNWNASTDNVGVIGYNVFRNGALIGSPTNTALAVTGLTPNTSYAFTAFARDATGNTSATGNTVNVTTPGASFIDYTSLNANLATVDWRSRDFFASRNVGIGTTNTQGYRLAVAGGVVAEEINVALQNNWPDFVFEKDYELPNLKDVQKHIIELGRLPSMPSAEMVEIEGIIVGEMITNLLLKIEELTLYAIQQENRILELENVIQHE